MQEANRWRGAGPSRFFAAGRCGGCSRRRVGPTSGRVTTPGAEHPGSFQSSLTAGAEVFILTWCTGESPVWSSKSGCHFLPCKCLSCETASHRPRTLNSSIANCGESVRGKHWTRAMLWWEKEKAQHSRWSRVGRREPFQNAALNNPVPCRAACFEPSADVFKANVWEYCRGAGRAQKGRGGGGVKERGQEGT